MGTKEEVLRTFGAMQSGLSDEEKRRIIGKAYDLFLQLRTFNDEIRRISVGSGLSLHGRLNLPAICRPSADTPPKTQKCAKF